VDAFPKCDDKKDFDDYDGISVVVFGLLGGGGGSLRNRVATITGAQVVVEIECTQSFAWPSKRKCIAKRSGNVVCIPFPWMVTMKKVKKSCN
jgi:hypothetical protein